MYDVWPWLHYRCSDIPSDSLIVLNAIEVVAECLLEPVPVQDSMPVSVQGRLCERANFG